ncbi:MAG: TrkH family potassium uptake protein [Spirochaetaceae bacterium]|jgi:trk system potassium uptake protein TrkH|nr:TrkH family potassium uptake protein [Spirochaetaceae bacterium]
MRYVRLLRILILILGLVALTMVPCLVMALVLGESAMIRAFVFPMGITLGAALPAAALYPRRKQFRLRSRDGFLLVFLAWVFAAFLGAIPYYFAEAGIRFTDAVFESTCGFATTGASTIADVEALPQSLILWRSLSHWFGGMGIVLLTVALMPILGVGGFQLIKAESPGPEKEKITPKVTATAKLLWLAYGVLTALLAGLFRLGGMRWFDAACHAFTIMASGGVSTKNSGLAFYNSVFIDGTAAVFMLLAGLNFSLFYQLLRGKFSGILRNSEGRAYFIIFLAAASVITLSLLPVYGSAGTALRYAVYQTASILSTTGSAIADYETWPDIARMVLFGLMFVGGCSGSTAGGIKVIRHLVLWKQAGNELRRIIYPQGIFSVRLNRKVGRKDVVYGVAGFIFLYMLVVAITTLAVAAASGTDLFSSFSAAVSVTGNVGTGFGAVGPAHTYRDFPDHIKWLFSFVMIAGRLELWTVFILFTPEYWRR